MGEEIQKMFMYVGKEFGEVQKMSLSVSLSLSLSLSLFFFLSLSLSCVLNWLERKRSLLNTCVFDMGTREKKEKEKESE